MTSSKSFEELSEREQALCLHPLAGTETAQAMREVGYSDSYIKRESAMVRQRLAPFIRERQEALIERQVISAERVQNELACLGFANIMDYFVVDEATGHHRPKQVNELTRAQAAAIQEFETGPMYDEDGKQIQVIVRLKLADKRANLVELGKTLGMFSKLTIDLNDKRNAVPLDDVPTDVLEAAEQMLLNAARSARQETGDRKAITADYTTIEMD